MKALTIDCILNDRSYTFLTGRLVLVHLARTDHLAVSGFDHEIGLAGLRCACFDIFHVGVFPHRLDAVLGALLVCISLTRQNNLTVGCLEPEIPWTSLTPEKLKLAGPFTFLRCYPFEFDLELRLSVIFFVLDRYLDAWR